MILELIPRVEELWANMTVIYAVSHARLLLRPRNASSPLEPFVMIAADPDKGYRMEYPTIREGSRRGRTMRTTARDLDEACAMILLGMERSGDWSGV